MKPLLFSTTILALFLMGYTSINGSLSGRIDKDALRQVKQKKSLSIVSCSPDWSAFALSDETINGITPLPGTGSHTWKISTSSDSAQFYFNQGINLYYGFHIIEALPSFKKALRFDSSSAILHWAVALAYGPNINDYGYSQSPDALLELSKAKTYLSKASPKEKELVDAMDAHYSADSTQERAQLNQAYADKMKALYLKYSTDAEIGSLYADALMNLHPWNFWQHDGSPQPWTPELMRVLENVLLKYPNHPGANHYYIHTMEASPFASKANASADRLGGLTPGLSHMLHMPSHIYIRTGEYRKGVKVNQEAVKYYYIYKKLYPEVANGAFLYEYHNLHMQAASSMNTSDYAMAIRDAQDCRNAIDTSYLSMEGAMGDLAQYVYMTPAFTWITFQKWKEILNEPEIEYRHHYGKLIREFAKGMALANTGKLDQAKSSITLMDTLLLEKDMLEVLTPFNAAATGGTVAKYILLGTIAEKENRLADAIAYYKKGVATEDSLVYQEPRDWLVPARHYLGNLLLRQKQYKEAEKVFRADLSYQPGNYISTSGLKKARRK